MHTLIISSSFPGLRCGVGDYVYRLARQFGLEGLDILVITSKRQEIIDFIQSKKGRVIKVFPDIEYWDKRAVKKITSLVEQYKPDCVHLHYHWWMYNDGFLKGMAFSQIFSDLRKKGFKNRLVVTLVHDLMGPYLFPKAGPLRQIYLHKLLAASDQIIVHTDIAKRTLNCEFPEFSEKIKKIPCGAGILPLLDTPITMPDGFNISFFGFIYPQKGLDYLIEALDILRKDNIYPSLWIIGAEDIDHAFSRNYADKLKQRINKKNLSKQVRWFNYQSQEEVSAILRASSISVLPFTEGVSERSSSLPTILAHGLPLVTTKSERTPSSLVHQENCMLVLPCNSLELAAAIKQLFKSTDLRQKLAQSAKDLYEREYSWRVLAKNVLQIYKE